MDCGLIVHVDRGVGRSRVEDLVVVDGGVGTSAANSDGVVSSVGDRVVRDDAVANVSELDGIVAAVGDDVVTDSDVFVFSAGEESGRDEVCLIVGYAVDLSVSLHLQAVDVDIGRADGEKTVGIEI